MNNVIKFIDLFAGIGGIRKGFELACDEFGFKTECVFTSEIKPYAIDVLKQNHPNETIHGDITLVNEKDIPDFDFLLAGFPCQAFSAAGKRLGFLDMAEHNLERSLPLRKLTVCSLFSGIGGIDLGFIQAGFQVVRSLNRSSGR